MELSNAKSNFIGKDPKGVVAAAIYLIARRNGYSLTQLKIAQIACVTDVTVRSRMRELEDLI